LKPYHPLLFTAPIFFLMGMESFAGWEESLTFFPVKYPSGYYRQTESSFMTVEDAYFTTSDGLKLHGWIARPKRL